MKTDILVARDDTAIDALCGIKVLLSVLKDGEFVNKEVPLISPEFLAMIDNMLYILCYGHKAMFEDRVPASTCLDLWK